MTRYRPGAFSAFRLLAWLPATLLAGQAAGAGDPERSLWSGVPPTGTTIVVVGATSRTAQQFIPQAVAAGHAVVALTRRPEDFRFRNRRVRVARADVYDPQSLQAVLTGREVVVSFIGLPDPDTTREVAEVDLYSRGAANLIAAMKARGNRRLVFTTSMGLTIEPPASRPDPAKDPRMAFFWNVRAIYADERRAEALIRSSGLDYIILRPAFIVQQPSRGYTIPRQELPYPINPVITYADFAAFALEQTTSSEFVGQAIGVDDGRVFRVTARGLEYE